LVGDAQAQDAATRGKSTLLDSTQALPPGLVKRTVAAAARIILISLTWNQAIFL